MRRFESVRGLQLRGYWLIALGFWQNDNSLTTKTMSWGIFLLLCSATLLFRVLDPWESMVMHFSPEPQFQNFSDFVTQKKQILQVSPEITLVAVGDIMLSRTVTSKIKQHNDLNYPFLQTANFLKNADLTFGNLENSIIAGPVILPYTMTLRGDPGIEKALKNSGFDILSLANNHVPNSGTQGVLATLEYLDKIGLAHVGAGENSTAAQQPAYFSRQGLTFAFLGYNDSDVVPAFYEAAENRPGTAFMRIEQMVAMVELAKTKADFVIVSMHSGQEYVPTPNQAQINFAHAAIDAGAELVLGHHPHVIQTLEQYQGKYIFYSLGNFIFDQDHLAAVKQGLALKIYFNQAGVREILPLPVIIQNYAQPKFLPGDAAAQVLERLDYPLMHNLAFIWDQETNQIRQTQRQVIKNDQINQTSEFRSQVAEIGDYKFSLQAGKLKISLPEKTIWESPAKWWIENFELADSNHDGRINVNLSIWQTNNSEKAKFFWQTKKTVNVKNYFLIFAFEHGVMQPIWQSTSLAAPNCAFQFADVNGDSKQDLVVLVGDYTQAPKCSGKYLVIWEWDGLGFTKTWQSASGNYRNFRIENIGNQTEIIVAQL